MADSVTDSFKKIIEASTADDAAQKKFLKEAIEYDEAKKKEFWKAVLASPNNGKKFWTAFGKLQKDEKEQLLKTAEVLSEQQKSKLLDIAPNDETNIVISLLTKKKGGVLKSPVTTYIIGLILMGGCLGVAYGYWKGTFGIENTIIFITIILFIGILFLSAQHRQTQSEAQEKQAKGIMRRAIAGTIIVVYLISFAALTFGPYEEKDTLGKASTETITQINQTLNQILKLEDLSESENLQEELTKKLEGLKVLQDTLKLQLDSQENMLGHFTTVVTAVIGFYFGTKVVEDIVSKKNSKKNNKGEDVTKKGEDVTKKGEDVTKKDVTDMSKKVESQDKKLDEIIEKLKEM